MTDLPDFVRKINHTVYLYRYSICTLVTHRQEYLEMLDSFITAGFTDADCEFLLIDNREANLMDAYDGINQFLHNAKGEYVIICHQDVILTKTSTRQILEQQINEITSLDPKWAVLGNAGASARLYNRLAINIAYPNGFVDKKGTLPQQVYSVDENFIITKNSANLSLSGDIGGYHLYGLDICHIANALGYNAYVIAFLLIHKSTGNVDDSFTQTLKKVKKKYVTFMKARYINTTIAKFYLSGSRFWNMMFNTRAFRRVIKTCEEIKAKLTR